MSLSLCFAFLSVASAVYYAWFISIAYRGLRRLRSAPPSGATVHRVSVLVPARNEESNIGACLTALRAQDYPRDLLEIIVIDDGSTDRTSDIVKSHAEHDPRIRLLHLEPETRLVASTKRGRKPEALATAIREARGSVIITTDADCVAPSSWVRTMIRHIDAGAAYVVGPVLEQGGENAFTRLRALEVLGGMAVTAGRIGIGRPINGHGGNTAFLREIYDRTGGFDFGAVKSDEETMMHRIVDQHLGRVWFAATPNARVRTASPESLGGFWNQRMRWGSMHRHFADRKTLIQLAVLYLSILFPLIGLLLGLQDRTILFASIFALLSKMCIDVLTLRSGARLFGERVPFGTFLLGESLHSLYIVIFGAVAQFARYRWKDRTVLAFKPVGNASEKEPR